MNSSELLNDGQIVKIAINPGKASKRTRKRVKDAGGMFIYHKNTNRPGSILLKSRDTGWFGWLPLDEIRIDR
jgi:hypothetical protein